MNEIQFLLNFDFNNAGAKEAQDWLTRFIAYFGDFNDIVNMSGPALDKFTAKQKELTAATQMLAEATAKENGVSKESIAVIQSAFSEVSNLKKGLDSVISSKKILGKTTEELTGELTKAVSMVKKYTGQLIEMETENKKVGEGWAMTTNKLNTWKQKLLETREEIKNASEAQKEYSGIITNTREAISALTEQLDQYTSAEELASEGAKQLKDQIAGLNELLKQLQRETSGQLTIEQALNKTRENNIKMQNDMIALDERSIEIKAQLVAKEAEYSAAVKDRVNQIQTGYTLEEEALLKKEIAEEEAFDKSWILGQQWLRQQEEIFDKAWRAGEDYQIKLQRANQETFDKAWISGEQWLAQEEARFNKAWAAGEKYQAEQEAAFDKAWRQGEDWQIKQAQIAEKAELQKQEAIEKTTIMYKLQTYIVRDLFRVVAAMLTIIPIMALLSFIVDFTKALFGFGEASEKVKGQILKFNETVSNGAIDVYEKITEETEALKILIQTSQDLDTSYETRVKSINSVRDAYGELLDKYSDVEIAESKKAKDDINRADTLKMAAENTKNIYQQTLKDIAENEKTIKDAPEKWDAAGYNSFLKYLPAPGKFDINNSVKRAKGQLDIDEADLPTRKSDYEAAQKAYNDFLHPANNALKISKYEAELKELQRQNESTDYSKYGLTDASSKQDVINMKNKNTSYQSDTNFQISEIRRLKDVIAELRGAKDAKGPKGRAPRDLEEARALEKARNAGAVDDINGIYDASPMSDLDKSAKYDALLKQASEHAQKMEAINKKYEESTKDSKTKMATYRQDDLNDFKKTNNEIQKAGNADVLASQKYNEAKLEQIKKINKQMRDIVEDARRSAEEGQSRSAVQKIKQRSLSAFNAIGAFFGNGGQDVNQDIKDRDSISDIEIGKLERSRKSSGDDFSDAEIAQRKAQQQVDTNGKVENPGVLQKEKFEKDNKALEEANGNYKTTQDKFQKDNQSLQDAVNKKYLDGLDDKKKGEIMLAVAAADAVNKIANASFAAQQKRIQIQMSNLQNQYSLEQTLAGNNSSAKIRLALTEHRQMLALKREEAEASKNAAAFGAVVNTAEAVTKALTGAPPPYSFIMAALVGAAGLYQVAKITSEPLPQYKKGRKGGKKEFARLNEEGFEIGQLKSGELRIHNEGKDGISLLQEGETIHTHKESNKFMQDILKGTKVHIQQKTLSKEDMKWAMTEAMKDMKTPVIQMPARGVEDRLQRTQTRNLA